MCSASRWTLGMALTPAIVAMLGFLVMFLDHLASLPEPVVRVATHTMLAAMFGGVVLFPGIACTVAAAPLVRQAHRFGRRTAVIGLALLALGNAAIICGLFDWANTPGDSRDPQFFSRPTVTEAAITTIPFALLLLGDLYAMRKVQSDQSAVMSRR